MRKLTAFKFRFSVMLVTGGLKKTFMSWIRIIGVLEHLILLRSATCQELVTTGGPADLERSIL